MKTEIILRMEMMRRAVGVIRHYNLAAPGSHLDARCFELEAVGEELFAAAAGQEAAHRVFRAEALRRGAASAALHEWMADVARVARSLPKAQYGGVAENFRMPRSQSYQAQQASARAFIKALRSMQKIFAPRGFDETFVEEAETMLAEIETANGAKISGILARIAETATLMLRSSHGLAIVRELDAILQRKLRGTALLAEWNSARHVHRPRKKMAAIPPQPSAPAETAVGPAPSSIGDVPAGIEAALTGPGSPEVRTESIGKVPSAESCAPAHAKPNPSQRTLGATDERPIKHR